MERQIRGGVGKSGEGLIGKKKGGSCRKADRREAKGEARERNRQKNERRKRDSKQSGKKKPTFSRKPRGPPGGVGNRKYTKKEKKEGVDKLGFVGF